MKKTTPVILFLSALCARQIAPPLQAAGSDQTSVGVGTNQRDMVLTSEEFHQKFRKMLLSQDAGLMQYFVSFLGKALGQAKDINLPTQIQGVNSVEKHVSDSLSKDTGKRIGQVIKALFLRGLGDTPIGPQVKQYGFGYNVTNPLLGDQNTIAGQLFKIVKFPMDILTKICEKTGEIMIKSVPFLKKDFQIHQLTPETWKIATDDIKNDPALSALFQNLISQITETETQKYHNLDVYWRYEVSQSMLEVEHLQQNAPSILENPEAQKNYAQKLHRALQDILINIEKKQSDLPSHYQSKIFQVKIPRPLQEIPTSKTRSNSPVKSQGTSTDTEEERQYPFDKTTNHLGNVPAPKISSTLKNLAKRLNSKSPQDRLDLYQHSFIGTKNELKELQKTIRRLEEKIKHDTQVLSFLWKNFMDDKNHLKNKSQLEQWLKIESENQDVMMFLPLEI